MHIYSSLFEDKLFKKYEQFMALCYETHTGWGRDAKIKSMYSKREKALEWGGKYKGLFLDEYEYDGRDENSRMEEKKQSYHELIKAFMDGLEIMPHAADRHIDTPDISR